MASRKTVIGHAFQELNIYLSYFAQNFNLYSDAIAHVDLHLYLIYIYIDLFRNKKIVPSKHEDEGSSVDGPIRDKIWKTRTSMEEYPTLLSFEKAGQIIEQLKECTSKKSKVENIYLILCSYFYYLRCNKTQKEYYASSCNFDKSQPTNDHVST